MSSAVVIDNPVINSPYRTPDRHFEFTEEGISGTILPGRRKSAYFVPIAKPKKKPGGQQLLPGNEWTKDRLTENPRVNEIRALVDQWRRGGRVSVTPTTRELLDYWTDPEREKPLFFCQIEALETAIFLTEVAPKHHPTLADRLREANDSSNPGLPRVAFKMATGSGKTVVMAMLIAWQALNKLANPKDARFSDAFLVVTPGITIRDRLRVLLPSDPGNYYRERDLLPPALAPELGRAKIVITNFHAFQPREKLTAPKLTKTILGDGATGVFTESPGEMVRRVCRELGTKRNIVVLNDEAHHCYRRKPDDPEGDRLTGDDRREADQRDREARIWISGVEAVKAKLGVRAIYDLSATPFFLRGSGYPEGTLFPWVVSDFSLIDAIEAGIVKVPRVPVADDAMSGDLPTYRDLWLRIREHLPKKGKKAEAVDGEPRLPKELEAALLSLYGNYERSFRAWEANLAQREGGPTPPVFIVVCNNTNVSKMVFDYIAGWEKPIDGRRTVQAGKLGLFRNDDERGNWRGRPRTILVDSAQLESGEAMGDDFKRAAAREIEEFKAEVRQRFPGRDTDKLTDEDLLREVMNTVGKSGRLGEGIRCVVSVSMLTEGWDANTVTHILGVRAFGTQLLCEQVVGRALRRMSYALNAEGRFDPEYAEVYGVPFSFIPATGGPVDPPKLDPATRVRALDSRIDAEITFPRLVGYRYEIPDERLVAAFDESDTLALGTEAVPTMVESAPVIGPTVIHTLEGLEARRLNEVAFALAKHLLDAKFRDDDGDRPWLFPQLLRITKQWLAERLVLKDGTFPGLLLIRANATEAVDRIYRAIVRGQEQAADGRAPALRPTLRPYDPIGSTRYTDFDTRKPVWPTSETKCHINYVAADTDTWEQKMAQTLETMPEVLRYAKNQGFGFAIPYAFEGREHQYLPDFLAVLDDGRGPKDPLNLIVEVTGEAKRQKAAKTATARDLWVPAVNNHGGFGRWAFVEVTDPFDAANVLRGVALDGNARDAGPQPAA